MKLSADAIKFISLVSVLDPATALLLHGRIRWPQGTPRRPPMAPSKSIKRRLWCHYHIRNTELL